MVSVKLCLSVDVCEDESAAGLPEGDVPDALLHAGRALHVLVGVQHHAILQRPHVDLRTHPLRSRPREDRVEGVLLRAPAVVAVDARDGHEARPVRVPGRRRAQRRGPRRGRPLVLVAKDEDEAGSATVAKEE
jgi:hypothetical protein